VKENGKERERERGKEKGKREKEREDGRKKVFISFSKKPSGQPVSETRYRSIFFALKCRMLHLAEFKTSGA
jgi:hypothetical protein